MSEENPYPDVEPDEWFLPKMDGYKAACCDCGLVHLFSFQAGRIREDGFFIHDPALDVAFKVIRLEDETRKERARRTRENEHKPRPKPKKTKAPEVHAGAHISAKDRHFCWGSVPDPTEQ